jgi:hypothetical protein
MHINSIRLSVQAALLGHITPNLRAVYVQNKDDINRLVFYYDNPPSEDEQELASLADTEFISHSSYDYETACDVLTLPYPAWIPKDGVCVYLRYEGELE